MNATVPTFCCRRDAFKGAWTCGFDYKRSISMSRMNGSRLRAQRRRKDNKFTIQGGALTYYFFDNMTSPGSRQATRFIAMPLCYKAFGRVHRLVSPSRSHHDFNILNSQNRERNMFNKPPQDFRLTFLTILGVYRTHFKDTITRSRLYLKIKGPPSHQPRKRPETMKEDQVAMPHKSE